VTVEMLDISDADLRRRFLIGVLGVAILFVLIGGLIAAYGSGAERPEGVAERWLVDVGDLTRKGVRDEAREAVAEVGSLELGQAMLPAEDTDGRAAFTDLEVGKADTVDGRARVPFQLHPREGDDVGDVVDGTVVLQLVEDEAWRVVAVEGPTEGLAVPSEGGRPAAEAPIGLFAGAIGLSALITLGAVVALRAAGPAPAS
jgi:hypothetical protein